MTLAANAFTSYTAKGLREDLSNIIYNVDDANTNFVDRISRGRASNSLREWQTVATPAVSTTNAQLEGDVFAMAASTATVRLNNYCQIAWRTFGTTASEEAIDKAGRESELGFQTTLFGMALRRDIEAMCFLNQAKVAGNATTARKYAGILSWIATNDVFGASGVSPTGDGSDARTDGTQRPFTETQLQDVAQLIWTASGGTPSGLNLYVGGFNKRVASGFTGVATKFKDVDDKRIMATADVYVSDFGEINIVPNPNMRSRDALMLNLEYWGLAELRPMTTKEIMTAQFDGSARVVLNELTLESRNEKASGGIFDLTTS